MGMFTQYCNGQYCSLKCAWDHARGNHRILSTFLKSAKLGCFCLTTSYKNCVASFYSFSVSAVKRFSTRWILVATKSFNSSKSKSLSNCEARPHTKETKQDGEGTSHHCRNSRLLLITKVQGGRFSATFPLLFSLIFRELKSIQGGKMLLFRIVWLRPIVMHASLPPLSFLTRWGQMGVSIHAQYWDL